MVYDWREQDLGPGKVTDANGVSYDHVFRVDTETGEMLVGDLDTNGKLQMNEAKTEVLKKAVQAEPPVMVIWS